MSLITIFTRRKSNEKEEVARPVLYTKILSMLSEKESFTAREIANKVGRFTRQDVQPRLTELEKLGLIMTDNKRYDAVTRRTVATYRLISNNDKYVK